MKPNKRLIRIVEDLEVEGKLKRHFYSIIAEDGFRSWRLHEDSLRETTGGNFKRNAVPDNIGSGSGIVTRIAKNENLKYLVKL